MEFVATCPKGLERLLSAELVSLGLTQVRALTGQVTFSGSIKDGYRACLWSRIASRIICIFERIDATDSDELYEGVAHIAWEHHIPRGKSIAVDAHGTNDNLRNTQFIALRTKDGIADRMLSRAGIRIATDPTHPDLRIACSALLLVSTFRETRYSVVDGSFPTKTTLVFPSSEPTMPLPFWLMGSGFETVGMKILHLLLAVPELAPLSSKVFLKHSIVLLGFSAPIGDLMLGQITMQALGMHSMQKRKADLSNKQHAMYMS